MAWLFKQSRSKNWYIGWRVGSKLFNKSTGETKRTEAEKALATYNLLSEANRQKRLTEEMFYSLTGQDAPRVSLKAQTDLYLETFKGKNTAGSYARYKAILLRFCEYLHANERAPLLNDVTPDALQQFLNGVRADTSTNTVNFYIKVFKAFFNSAVENKKIRANPLDGLSFYKATIAERENQRRAFEPEELQRVYLAAPTPFWRFAISFGFYTGLRLGNIATLRWRNWDPEKRLVSTIGNKDGEDLEIPICSKFLLDSFTELRSRSRNAKPDDFIFPEAARKYLTKQKHGEVSTGNLSAEFRDILVTANLAKEYQRKDQGTGRSCRRAVSPLSFHSLRHSFVTTLKASGAPQMVARAVVGHDSDEVSELYTHTSTEMVRLAIKKLPEVFNAEVKK